MQTDQWPCPSLLIGSSTCALPYQAPWIASQTNSAWAVFGPGLDDESIRSRTSGACLLTQWLLSPGPLLANSRPRLILPVSTVSFCRRKELGLPEGVVLKPETAEEIAAAHASYLQSRKSKRSLPSRKSIMSQDIFASKGVKKRKQAVSKSGKKPKPFKT